jgi:hypothetical protein
MYIVSHFLNVSSRWRNVVTLRPSRFTPGRKPPPPAESSAHEAGRVQEPVSRLRDERKIFSCCQESIHSNEECRLLGFDPVSLVTTDVSEERDASLIRVKN